MIASILGKGLSLPNIFNFSSGKKEERPSRHLNPVERGLVTKIDWAMNSLILAGIIADGILTGVGLHKANKADKTQSTTGSATQPASTGQVNSPRAIARRKERPFGRGLPVDISGGSHPKSHLQRVSVADGIVTIAGNSEARSFSDKSNQDR